MRTRRLHPPDLPVAEEVTVALVMCAGGRAANPVAAVESVIGLIDSYHIVNTGDMGDNTRAAILELPVDGEVVDDPFDGSGPSFTRALGRARGSADWLLHLHSDETAEVFPAFREWLDGYDEPTDVFQVPIVNPGLVHRLPRLMRGDLEWRYVGNAHEYLEIAGRSTRWLNGLDIHHHGGPSGPEKFEYVLEQLEAEYLAGEPRATFYTAEALRDLGLTVQAVSVYLERAAMRNGWEEERWYAQYQAAKLAGDVDALLSVWRERPHRHEPLMAAARIVAARGTEDVLFVEDVG